MKKLHYNLSEEEFTRDKKILLWVFAGLFFLAGVFILIKSLVIGHKNIPAILSLAPFGISLFVSIIAALATIKKQNLFFTIDDNKIEFRYGIFRPKKHSFPWSEIKGLTIPGKQKKAMLLFYEGSPFVIDLTWLQKKKSSHIRKYIYMAAKEKGITINKVQNITSKI